MAKLESRIPSGPLADKWRKHKTEIKLVNPANKRKYEVIVVGAGLAGGSAAATARVARPPGQCRPYPVGGHHLGRDVAPKVGWYADVDNFQFADKLAGG